MKYYCLALLVIVLLVFSGCGKKDQSATFATATTAETSVFTEIESADSLEISEVTQEMATLETSKVTQETANAPSNYDLLQQYWSGSLTEGSIQVVHDGEIWNIADSLGNIVELKPYQRLVVTSGGAIETLYLVEAEQAIVGVGTSSSGIWPEEKTSQLTSVGNLARPSFEKIVELEPDLVVLNGMNSALAEQLAGVGIQTFLHGSDSMQDIINSLLIFGLIGNTMDKAVELVVEKQKILATIRAELDQHPLHMKGAFLYSVGPIMAFQADTLPGEVLKTLGIDNIADRVVGSQPILSSEFLLTENPDVLFGAMSISSAEDILEADPVIARTSAGQQGNVAILPSSLILRPTPRLIDELWTLYDLVVQMVE